MSSARNARAARAATPTIGRVVFEPEVGRPPPGSKPERLEPGRTSWRRWPNANGGGFACHPDDLDEFLAGPFELYDGRLAEAVLVEREAYVDVVHFKVVYTPPGWKPDSGDLSRVTYYTVKGGRKVAGKYEVFPDGDEWSYRYRSEQGKAENRGDNFATRSEAIAAAKAARGDTDEELFRADGSPAGRAVARGREAIVLLRPDGSVYGELDHEDRSDGNPQHITIQPAGETAEAVNGG